LGHRPFPHNAVLWVNVTDDLMAGYISVPSGGRLENYWRYDFHLLGVGFTLFLGGLVPKKIRRFCFVRSREHFIVSGKIISEMIVSQAGKLFAKTNPVGSLAQWVEDRNSHASG
jgi:hypothetical protein